MKFSNLVLIVCGLAVLSGCSSNMKVRYTDPTQGQVVSTEFSSTDLQLIAGAMVDSMMTFQPLAQITNLRQPVIMVDKVKNKTMQHIDTESVTDSIRAKLVKSGKFRFVDRTTEDAVMNELNFQKTSGMVDPAKAVETGKQYGAEYIVTGNISEITQTNTKVTDTYYKFTLVLKNLNTGLIDWTDEKEIRKIGTRGMFGN
ncbi:MAG: penicillin-binding protein activator LpoB [Candidatus Omnitrophica bacterium]|nr:penicillin-binding protein activator LpoB [Candidatus Omnitrophota bacterium]